MERKSAPDDDEDGTATLRGSWSPDLECGEHAIGVRCSKRYSVEQSTSDQSSDLVLGRYRRTRDIRRT